MNTTETHITSTAAAGPRTPRDASPVAAPRLKPRPPAHTPGPTVSNLIQWSGPHLVTPDNPIGLAHVPKGLGPADYLHDQADRYMDLGIGVTVLWPQGALPAHPAPPAVMCRFRGRDWPTRMLDAAVLPDTVSALLSLADELHARNLPPLTLYVVAPYSDHNDLSGTALFNRFGPFMPRVEGGLIRLAFDSGAVLAASGAEWFERGTAAIAALAPASCAPIGEGPIPVEAASHEPVVRALQAEDSIDMAVNHAVKARDASWVTSRRSERMFMIAGLDQLEQIGEEPVPDDADWIQQTLPFIRMARREAARRDGASRLHIPCVRFEEAVKGSVQQVIAAVNAW